MFKRIARAAFAVTTSLVGLSCAYAMWVYMGPLSNEAGLTYSTTYTLDLSNTHVDSLSMMTVYSTVTYANKTFTDGTASTGSITVTSLTNLAGAQGTNSIVISTQAGLSGATISIGGTTLTESSQWWTQTSTNAVATSIKNGINTYAPQFVASIGSQRNKVTITCGSSGTWCNNQTLSVSVSSMQVGAATFSGGVDNAILAINNVTLIQGRDWNVGASTAATANAIAAAINSNSSLSSIVVATAPVSCVIGRCGVVIATTTAVGTSTTYALFSSSHAALTLSGTVTTNALGQGSSAMTGGTNSAYSLSTDQITIASHGFTKALPVLYSTDTVTIGGLTNQTTYYVVVVDANTIGLSSTSAVAQTGNYINLTSSSTGTTAHTFTLAPLSFTGTPSWKWQVSNDNSNWVDMNTSSVTFSSPYTASSYLWNFGNVPFRYMRLNVVGPTTGGMSFVTTGNGVSGDSR